MGRRTRKFLRWWRGTGIGFRRLLTVCLLIIAGFIVYYIERPTEDSPIVGNNLLVFSLVNLNIIFLCILAFVIGRNVVKLVFDRRRKILGSKLRMRLVLAFAGLALVTNVVLFIFAGGLLSRAMEGWFSSQVETSVSGAVDVAKSHYNYLKEVSARTSRRLVEQLGAKEIIGESPAQLSSSLERLRQTEGLFSIRIYGPDKHIIAEGENAAAVIESFSEPPLDSKAFEKALRGNPSIIFEEKEASHFIRSYRLLAFPSISTVLVTNLRVDPELSNSMSVVNDSFKEYEQLKLFKSPLKSGYLLTLSMITGVILFSAIWFGFYLAKQISVLIQQLAEGTRAVARGNYDFQLSQVGDDEIGFLVRSFNTMIEDLRTSREEAERRRLFIETVLSNLAVGVIAIDKERKVTSVNAAAARLFSLDDLISLQGEALHHVLARELVEDLQPILLSLESSEMNAEENLPEKELSVISEGTERKVLCTAGLLRDHRGEVLGALLLFDDITELSKAQHMAVWREVARRIAHEIKNPLTPIQLSAQRLVKLSHDLQGGPVIQECARTIVENVDSIKTLANEFSKFARMPTLEFTRGNLNTLLSEVVALYAGSNPNIVFQFIPEKSLPEVLMDRDQMRRLLINLIENAVAALQMESPASDESPRIVIRSTYDAAHRVIGFEVLDNGPGISHQDKLRIFEPYFTTKKGGTGLGLAIVNTIVSDHQGDIRVFDNKPRGARFVVQIPCDPKVATQRRLAVV